MDPGLLANELDGTDKLEAAAEEASTVALWAYTEQMETPWWRPLRRRFLAKTFDRYADISARARDLLDPPDSPSSPA